MWFPLSLPSEPSKKPVAGQKGAALAACPRLRFRVDVLVEKLRGEETLRRQTGGPLPDPCRGVTALARRDQDAMDAVNEFEMRCVRLKAGWPPSTLKAYWEVGLPRFADLEQALTIYRPGENLRGYFSPQLLQTLASTSTGSTWPNI
jgi:hypothetical protein